SRKKISRRAAANTMESAVGERCPVTGERSCHCLVKKISALFTEHAVYTMFYLKSAIFGNPDATYMLQRLLENQKDIGTNLGALPTVGIKNGRAVTKVLTEHIKLAGAAASAAITYYKQKTTAHKKSLDL